MRIKILETTPQVLFDSEKIGTSLRTLRRGEVLEVESIGLYNGKYSPSCHGHDLYQINFANGTYYVLMDFMYEVVK